MRRIQQFQPPAEILQPNAGTALVLSVVFREVAVADRADDPCPFLVNLQVDKRRFVVAYPMLESIFDQGDEEEFVPQPYRGKTSSKSVSKKKKEEKKKEPEKKEPPKKAEADDGQISLGDLSSFGEAA